jgi:transglutaminase-like putative cysteine protease
MTFTALTLQPLTAAAQLPAAPKRASATPQSDSGEERYSRLLKEMHEILKEVAPQAAMPHRKASAAPSASGKPGEKVLQAVGPKIRLESEAPKPLPGVDVAAKVKLLRAKYKELKSLEAEVTRGFKATEKHIRDAKLPAEILARQDAAVAEYEKRKAEFDALMQPVEAAADGTGNLPAALSNLGEFMAKYPNEKTHTPTDPNNLPWGSPKPVTRAPYTSPSQFKTSRLFGETVKVAQAGSLSGIGLPSAVLPVTPNAGDLVATEDAQITQPIRDLATSLNNDPVKIYNWVRNNIQFIPSYGSIQGSDMTLQTKRGNSFDTASLLIALLRAANIPARYVYGTIEVPADKVMNWVGGVTVPEAAMNLMGQGGIPNIGVAQGGQIQSIRMEHVWVEAYVDYTPSRGAVNRNPNTWVPMDASFKQYQFTQGIDIRNNVPLDTQSVLTQGQQGATVNQTEWWVQNFNQAAVQQAIANYQTQVTSYVSTQYPSATVGNVLGTQATVLDARPLLLGSLPYSRIATGSKFQTIPDNLRHKFQYALFASDTDRALDNPVFRYIQSLPNLAGKKITLSFAPATQADENLMTSYLPAPHADGTPVQ